MNKVCFLLILLVGSQFAAAQTDEEVIRSIYDEALTNSPLYEDLRFLCKRIGHRLAGSSSAAAAVEYTRQLMLEYDFDSVWLQPVMVPHWVRGEQEELRMISSTHGVEELTITALGNSVGTGKSGLSAEVVEVQDFKELKSLGKEKVEGKVVFFNRPFVSTLINTFRAYGGAVNQRSRGVVEAAKLGAVAVVVRSMSSQVDDVPHTGSLRYEEGVR